MDITTGDYELLVSLAQHTTEWLNQAMPSLSQCFKCCNNSLYLYSIILLLLCFAMHTLDTYLDNSLDASLELEEKNGEIKKLKTQVNKLTRELAQCRRSLRLRGTEPRNLPINNNGPTLPIIPT